jgi:hypothetical protein
LRAFAYLHQDQALDFRESIVGCLPLLVFFLLGALLGYVFWGDIGLLWGCGIGLALGTCSTGIFIWLLRKENGVKK